MKGEGEGEEEEEEGLEGREVEREGDTGGGEGGIYGEGRQRRKVRETEKGRGEI